MNIQRVKNELCFRKNSSVTTNVIALFKKGMGKSERVKVFQGKETIEGFFIREEDKRLLDKERIEFFKNRKEKSRLIDDENLVESLSKNPFNTGFLLRELFKDEKYEEDSYQPEKGIVEALRSEELEIILKKWGKEDLEEDLIAGMLSSNFYSEIKKIYEEFPLDKENLSFHNVAWRHGKHAFLLLNELLPEEDKSLEVVGKILKKFFQKNLIHPDLQKNFIIGFGREEGLNSVNTITDLFSVVGLPVNMKEIAGNV
jgi:hypothetical protein